MQQKELSRNEPKIGWNILQSFPLKKKYGALSKIITGILSVSIV